MARARLHLICGNCGCNDEWEWEYKAEESQDGELMMNEAIQLWCKNCSTLHDLNDNAKKKEI